MRPVVNGLKQKYSDKLKFINLDFDDKANASLEQKFKVEGQPTLVITDGQGNLVKRWVGVVAGEELARNLQLLVGPS